jgi:hypothetical protein
MPTLEKKVKTKKYFDIGNNINHESKKLMKIIDKNFKEKQKKELEQGTFFSGGSLLQNNKFDKEIKKKLKSLSK